MKIIRALLFALVIARPASADAASFGIIPSIFPRDPIDVDTYPEKMAMSQILEPLVSSDQFGNIASALAEKWVISDHGKVIRFQLRPDAVFSDGTRLTSADVVATLNRHWKSSKSHSYSLLNNIRRIKAVDEKTVEIRLGRPQVAIFKILSWDQYGILPAKWRFSKDSKEPYTGSGPYRLIKRGEGWAFVPNDRYHDKAALKITDWDLVFVPPSIPDLERIPVLPDYAPALRGPIIDLLKKNPRFDPALYEIRPRFGFSQILAWWNPHSPVYQSAAARHVKMGALRMLFERRRSALKLPAAFGLIPYGVTAHLVSAIPFEPLRKADVAAVEAKTAGTRIIRVGVPVRLRGDVFSLDDVAAVEKLLDVKFDIIERPGYDSPKSDVDIVIDIWAGGFNDPEGFIPIITDIAKMSLKEYLASLWPLYLKASEELDWTKRSELFRDFDRQLVAQERLLPGWRTEFFTLLRKDFVETEAAYRYTPRLLDVRRK